MVVLSREETATIILGIKIQNIRVRVSSLVVITQVLNYG